MVTIPELTAVAAASRTLELPVDESGTTKSVTLGQVYDGFETTVYDDYLVPGMALKGGASAPVLTAFRGTIFAHAFNGTGSTVHEGMFAIHLLHGLKAGTNLTMHIHWSHIIGAPTGNVRWCVDYTLARGYGAGVYAAPNTLTTIQAAGAQYSHHITNDDDMVIASGVEVEPDSILLGRVYRDPAHPSDTFANDAFLLHIDMHYQRARLGTTERNRPFTSGGF